MFVFCKFNFFSKFRWTLGSDKPHVKKLQRFLKYVKHSFLFEILNSFAIQILLYVYQKDRLPFAYALCSLPFRIFIICAFVYLLFFSFTKRKRFRIPEPFLFPFHRPLYCLGSFLFLLHLLELFPRCLESEAVPCAFLKCPFPKFCKKTLLKIMPHIPKGKLWVELVLGVHLMEGSVWSWLPYNRSELVVSGLVSTALGMGT